ncbi:MULTISPECIES: phage major capsid protein [unclassified Rhizobium]|uniref:phage major capsid protein n=1 Tax=unclassified Rhizobium TaxID=2613769 RepID=UPI00182E14C2|nr:MULTISPECIES: phage major capsid protein [unclassified Rhizobium]MBB3288165.1 HK97 family phage major capsid protein [Rhizobium sp. BK252]MBB3402971.1 HK97 family phage major capsid protein [Rhizobium sp. BK289]MBB3415548.1 HK97 family phage major capsid protein [Rhizobium sp. BK284]MBB3483371.1 HK97 family phage major capsid protein [Rhizobium sp. BK347]
MSLQALREKRAAKAKALNELVNKTDWNPEKDQPVYDAGMQEIDEIDAHIKRISDMNEKVARETLNNGVIEASERAGKDQKSAGAAVYAKWLRNGDKALTAEDWEIVRNTMSTTTPSEGGYTVATEVATSVLEALKAYGGMRAVADVIQTASGNPMTFPTSDGTSEEGEIVPENTAATDADVSFGTTGLPVYKYSSKVVTVPWELLQDSSVDIEAFVRGRLVTRLGRVTNRHFTVGTGVAQPNGIMVAAPIGVTAANGSSQVTSVTYDSLVDLQHSVDPAYREGGDCRFMMNDDTVRIVRKIKDGQQRPIFVPGYESGNPGGAPDRLLGSPIQVNQSVASMAASAKSIAFGDFNKYKIRDVMAIQMFRFTDSAYTKKGQVGFLAWMRSGGNFTDIGGAVKTFVNGAS